MGPSLAKKRKLTGFSSRGPSISPPTAVEGQEGFWIRASLVRKPESQRPLEIKSIETNVHFLGEGFNPDYCMVNFGNMNFSTVDLNSEFIPFSEVPKYNDSFYLSCDEILAQEQSVITMRMTLSEIAQTPAANNNLVLKYEYWNGIDWLDLGQSVPQKDQNDEGTYRFTDTTRAMTRSGMVRFQRPADMKAVDINGTEALWVRVRIVAGDFGKGGRHVQKEDGTWEWFFDSPVQPPVMKKIRFSYMAPAVEVKNIVVYDHFSFYDKSALLQDPDKEFFVFDLDGSKYPAAYIGLSGVLPKHKLPLYFKLDEGQRVKPGLGQNYFDDESLSSKYRQLTLTWQYWNGKEWAKLLVNDMTDSFHLSGYIEVDVPRDLSSQDLFGKDLVWIRVVFESGSFEKSPVVQDILTNTVYAWNKQTFQEEVIGSSSGAPNQKISLLRTPILSGMELYVREDSLPPAVERELIENEEGEDAIQIVENQEGQIESVWIRYHEVNNFYSSTSQSRHFSVDYKNQMIHFGDGIRGLIPPRAKNNIKIGKVQVGGGSRGNVAPYSVTTVRESVPFLAGCENPYPAEGGADLESLDSLKHRASGLFKSLNRAVTAEDYEWLAKESSSSVVRSKCLSRSGPSGEVI
jgi:hypothetical protein